MQQISDLAVQLRAAIEASQNTVDELADKTKVPRTTILALIEEPVAAVLPERVYLRGHLKVLAQSLKLDAEAMAAAFDVAYPVAPPPSDLVPPESPARKLAVSAGLYGIALLAVVVAFATAMR